MKIKVLAGMEGIAGSGPALCAVYSVLLPHRETHSNIFQKHALANLHWVLLKGDLTTFLLITEPAYWFQKLTVFLAQFPYR